MSDRGTNRVGIDAYYIVGPTAVGKSSVAQYIAASKEIPVLSADSMLVYRGMNVGTAKPSAEERGDVRYFGIDLVNPSENFSAWDYIESVRLHSSELEGCIVAGGTGLYVQGLLCGLTERPSGDDKLRSKWQEIIDEEGIEPLQHLLETDYPDAWSSLEDKKNPRRLIRALEIAISGKPVDSSWRKAETAIPGLSMSREDLKVRIAGRVDCMFDEGLVEEVRGLLEKHDELSPTAAQAIGYSEVISLINNECSIEEAKDGIVRRTGRLAKRQMTWFRNQMNIDWIEVSPGMEVSDVAGLVLEYWNDNGPACLMV